MPSGAGKLGRSLSGRVGAVERVLRWAASGRDPSRPLIWYHAPSVGEGLMAQPVIDLLRQQDPFPQFAYTYFSPSAEAFAHSLAVDVADYLPFDTTAAARALLAALHPQALVFSKVDVWPLLVHEAVAQGIPVALTSAALGSSSRRTSAMARWFLRDAYASLSAVGAADREDAARLVAIGARADRISVTGDVRYDQVWERVSAGPAHSAAVAALRSVRSTLVAGSTWPTDEHVLLAAWIDVVKRCPRARLVIAAHEPSPAHTTRMHDWARAHGLTAAPIDMAGPDVDVVVVDRVGILADLYALGTIAYVGGGFHAKGLHSVIEPAAYGVPVLFGPRGAASRDAALLIIAGGAFTEATAPALAARIALLFERDHQRGAAAAAARDVIANGRGAARRTADLVSRLLRP